VDRRDLGVRLLANGAWGFAATRELDARSVEGVARAAVAQARANRSALQYLRWNESPINPLHNIEMMGRPERIRASEAGDVGPAVIVPPLEVRGFNFTSVSDAV
jgi:hypothetical protein